MAQDMKYSSSGRMEIKRKEPSSGRGKGIPGFFGKWKDRKRSNANYTEIQCRTIRNMQYRRRS